MKPVECPWLVTMAFGAPILAVFVLLHFWRGQIEARRSWKRMVPAAGLLILQVFLLLALAALSLNVLACWSCQRIVETLPPFPTPPSFPTFPSYPTPPGWPTLPPWPTLPLPPR